MRAQGDIRAAIRLVRTNWRRRFGLLDVHEHRLACGCAYVSALAYPVVVIQKAGMREQLTHQLSCIA